MRVMETWEALSVEEGSGEWPEALTRLTKDVALEGLLKDILAGPLEN